MPRKPRRGGGISGLLCRVCVQTLTNGQARRQCEARIHNGHPARSVKPSPEDAVLEPVISEVHPALVVPEKKHTRSHASEILVHRAHSVCQPRNVSLVGVNISSTLNRMFASRRLNLHQQKFPANRFHLFAQLWSKRKAEQLSLPGC